MKIDQLKKLSPEERIRILKELEQEKKSEIEEARKLITESEQEIGREEEIKREIPIPQVKAVNIEQLFSKAEKQVFAAKRFAREENVEEAQEEARLEETVKEAVAKGRLAKEEEQEYVIRGLERPTAEFYGAVQNVYQQAKQELTGRGEISDETREQIMNLYQEQKARERADMEGVYNIPAAMEEKFNIAKQLVHNLVDWYRR